MFDEEAKDSRSASLHTATGPFSGAGSGFGESYSLANPSIHAGEEIPQPTIFNGKLKGYQLKGMNWLANLYEQVQYTCLSLKSETCLRFMGILSVTLIGFLNCLGLPFVYGRLFCGWM